METKEKDPDLQKGFTLIELLVVLGIIAVLTGLIAFNFNQARARARDVTRKSDMKNLRTALELYKNDNQQKYPNSADYAALVSTLQSGTYISGTIQDPRIAQSGATSWQQYTYSSASPYTSFTLEVCLENRADDAANGGDCGTAGDPDAGKIYQFISQ